MNQNPVVPDDGFTEHNLIYNNTIFSSDEGIGATRSHDNILENNNIFSNITSSEYLLSENSCIIIRGQQFDNALISEGGSATNNLVEVVDSGTIEVVEVNDEGDNGNDEEEGNYHNTYNAPYRNRLSDGDSIIVNS